jgi:hypothetical protein
MQLGLLSGALGPLGMARRAAGVEYLLRDEFTTAQAAPAVSPRPGEPGPGELTLTQIDGQFSINGDKLHFPVQATPVFGDQGFYSGGMARQAGRALTMLVELTAANAGLTGWGRVAAQPGNGTGFDGSIYFGGSGVISITPAASFSTVMVGSFSLNTPYRIAHVLRGTGVFHFIKGGAFTEWRLLWAEAVGSTATVRAAFSNHTNAGSIDYVRVADLPAPFNTDFGYATQYLPGNVAVGTTFAHEANCKIEFVVGALPTSGNIEVRFRRQDDLNYWVAQVRSDGDLRLWEIVAGAGTQRGIAGAGTVSAGTRVAAIADGSVIRAYSNNALRFTYSSASNFQNASAGLLSTLGVGGSISNLATHPLYPSGAALAALDAV